MERDSGFLVLFFFGWFYLRGLFFFVRFDVVISGFFLLLFEEKFEFGDCYGNVIEDGDDGSLECCCDILLSLCLLS